LQVCFSVFLHLSSVCPIVSFVLCTVCSSKRLCFLPPFICLSVRSIVDLVAVVVQWKCKKEVRSSIRHLIDDLEDTARKMLDHFK
jgi:hypothetical protein